MRWKGDPRPGFESKPNATPRAPRVGAFVAPEPRVGPPPGPKAPAPARPSPRLISILGIHAACSVILPCYWTWETKHVCWISMPSTEWAKLPNKFPHIACEQAPRSAVETEVTTLANAANCSCPNRPIVIMRMTFPAQWNKTGVCISRCRPGRVHCTRAGTNYCRSVRLGYIHNAIYSVAGNKRHGYFHET